MPRVRLGHGLYTYGFKTQKGRKVLKELKENNIVLEFQISSNVRLNNLNSIENHPLRKYIENGIHCVQGTDGAALYGTNSIDEQLSLQNFLDLSYDDVLSMKETESDIIEYSLKAFETKSRKLSAACGGKTLEEYLLKRMEEGSGIEKLKLKNVKRLDAVAELRDSIEEIPWNLTPVVLIGGSFNTEKRLTSITEEGITQLKGLYDALDPEEVCFVIGHRLFGYEKYLVEHNEKKFRIFAVVPALITKEERNRLQAAGVFIRISPESEGMGIYKSFNYEIFERRPSMVVAFDGNSAAANIIQEAKNGKGKALIFVWRKSKTLHEKAVSLEGYVNFFDQRVSLSAWIDSFRKK